eukprot:CAMPEP_0115038712 /NCGR_PEP_ID=MMETSP0216-20121206/43577_1 /TAXON_ID=223996 /ORGANISM="Protocruzia adherens, Strain Boccale" /LENGTH=293 /DNA_ID=CAMNT_0002419175 /DNA_START=106 /DNA_END=987 /DNA_ORIENTATION=+
MKIGSNRNNAAGSTLSNTNTNEEANLNGREFFCHVCRAEFTLAPTGASSEDEEELACTVCQSDCIEEIEQENHPRHFRPFRVGEEEENPAGGNNGSNNDQSQNQQQQQQNGELFNLLAGGGGPLGLTQALGGMMGPEGGQVTILNGAVPAQDGLDMGFLFRMLGDMIQPQNEGIEGFNGSFEDLLQMLMENDPNRYGTPPASENAVKDLERITVAESHLKDPEFTDCSVCKDNFEIGQDSIRMPCKHTFHDDCLLPWLKEHNSCPVCRHELTTDDQDYENRKKQTQSGPSGNV